MTIQHDGLGFFSTEHKDRDTKAVFTAAEEATVKALQTTNYFTLEKVELQQSDPRIKSSLVY